MHQFCFGLRGSQEKHDKSPVPACTEPALGREREEGLKVARALALGEAGSKMKHTTAACSSLSAPDRHNRGFKGLRLSLTPAVEFSGLAAWLGNDRCLSSLTQLELRDKGTAVLMWWVLEDGGAACPQGH